jgi:hypothetical protein
MTQPSASGRGAGAEPGRGPGLPGGFPAADSGPHRDRELRLGDFAQGGAGDACRSGPALAAAIARLSGPDWRCASATDDELIGLLGRWEALESWAAAGKLGVICELIRRRARPGLDGSLPMCGDLPGLWEEGLGHEVSAALQISLRAADKLVALAWDLQARLPGIGAALAEGIISPLKAQIISDELLVLDDEDAAAAEKLVLDQLVGQTPGQVGKLAAQAACTVDPDGAAKRREMAEREDARVRFWRDRTGASAMSAYGLPTDAALAADATIGQRAGQYRKAKIYPDARMEQLRVLAFCDILNGISAASRIAQAQASARAEAGTQAGPDAGTSPDTPAGQADGCPGSAGPADEDSDPRNGSSCDDPSGGRGDGDQPGPASGGPGDCDDPGGARDGETGTGAAPGTGDAGPVLSARSNLTLPLATLLGLAERPGTAHGLGPVDPALVRGLAAAAARSPHTKWCLTITDASGYAIGHGCAKPARKKRPQSPPACCRDGPWTFIRQDDPGPPGGFGTWLLALPGGRELMIKLGPVPVADCDHRHESHGYQPGDTLRHLVEIRDGECTFPFCSRHARNCDFEHATPYEQDGRTCACNAGARSRRCHRVKQSKGWTLTQPRPGWHQWTTPADRSYTSSPMKYPA